MRSLLQVATRTIDSLLVAWTQVSSLFDLPRARVRLRANAQAGSDRTILIGIIDRYSRAIGRDKYPNGEMCSGSYVVRLWLSTVEFGTPDVVATLTPTGAFLGTPTANEATVVTDQNGSTSLTVTIVGAASVYVHAVLGDEVQVLGPVEWV